MRQRYAKGLGGTLRCLPPEARALGAASAATVTLKTSLGVDLPTPVIDAPAAIAPTTGELSFVLVPANTPDPLALGYLYRAIWTYTIAGVQYQTDQVYEVNARLLKPTLTLEDVTPILPSAWVELLDGGAAAAEPVIATAWDDILDDLSAKGFRPDKILDPERLQRPHRSKVIAVLYGSFGPQWRESADRAEQVYERDLDAAISGLDWYDRREDGVRAADEKQVVQSVVLSR
jgi:hypothetical protein